MNGSLDDPREARARQDAQALRNYAAGLARLLDDLGGRPALWERNPGDALSADERTLVLQLFGRVLDYQVLYDGVASSHMGFWKIDPLAESREHALRFALAHAAWYSQVLLGLVFVERTLGKPPFESLLDEGSPQEGIKRGAYTRLKWNVVHLEDFGRVVAAHQYHKLLSLTAYRELREDPLAGWVIDELERRYQAVRSRLTDKGASMLLDNALDLLKDTSQGAWLPIQTEVARWMGDTKVHRIDAGLITSEQIAEATRQSRPGDLIVERRNWYLSNVGLPGFWPHLALWLGSPSELADFFNAEPEVLQYANGPFTALLRRRFPKAWEQYVSPDDRGHSRRILEAVSEGVVFASPEHSLAADYAAALRPRLPPLELAKAIERGFEYAGRPYDFDFDFFTDQALVCSELVYKAYEPRSAAKGLALELSRVLGRTVMTPNGLVAQFDRELGTPAQQLDFVWFLDGSESRENASFAEEGVFRKTHLRVKWDIQLLDT